MSTFHDTTCGLAPHPLPTRDDSAEVLAARAARVLELYRTASAELGDLIDAAFGDRQAEYWSVVSADYALSDQLSTLLRRFPAAAAA